MNAIRASSFTRVNAFQQQRVIDMSSDNVSILIMLFNIWLILRRIKFDKNCFMIQPKICQKRVTHNI